MQDANREIHDNDDLEQNEFDENNPEGQTVEEHAASKKTKDEHKQELERQREIQAQQKINDGISLTQGEIKKHEAIDWETSNKLNEITKSCINYSKHHYSF